MAGAHNSSTNYRRKKPLPDLNEPALPDLSDEENQLPPWDAHEESRAAASSSTREIRESESSSCDKSLLMKIVNWVRMRMLTFKIKKDAAGAK